MANKVTTEWFDLHVKHGNYLPLEKETTLYEDNKAYQEKIAAENHIVNVLDNKTVAEIKEGEDDLDVDDDFYREYMQRRMAEIKALSSKAKYGKVYEISRDEYVREVTEADPQSFVVLHMYQDYIEESVRINQWMAQLAPKYPLVKFVKIVATKCVEKFPDEDVPCIVIYKATKPVASKAQAHRLCGNTLQSFEAFLASLGAFKFNLTEAEIQKKLDN